MYVHYWLLLPEHSLVEMEFSFINKWKGYYSFEDKIQINETKPATHTLNIYINIQKKWNALDSNRIQMIISRIKIHSHTWLRDYMILIKSLLYFYYYHFGSISVLHVTLCEWQCCMCVCVCVCFVGINSNIETNMCCY